MLFLGQSSLPEPSAPPEDFEGGLVDGDVASNPRVVVHVSRLN